MKKDYYDVLGVNKDATSEQIKKAYRRAVLKHHPDRNKENEAEASEKFKEASEAYAVLGDDEKRDIYNRYGHEGAERANWNFNFDMSDIFGGRDIFGGADPFSVFFGHRRQQRGSDTQTDVLLTLEEIATGIEKQISFRRADQCDTCHGMGGTGISCSECRGQGRIRQHGPFTTIIVTCPKCNGKKIEITEICKKCQGKGKKITTETLSINIPPGIENNEVLVFQGKGNLSNFSFPRGNLRCIIKVKPHHVFKRESNHLSCEQEISFVDACLGKSISVSTIYKDQIELKIPKGTQFGQIFRILGKGLPNPSLHGNKGDMFVKIKIKVPGKLSSKASNLLRKFDEETIG